MLVGQVCIARSSALYPCLMAAPDFYAFHQTQRDLRDRPYRAACITAAAPNLGAIVRNQPHHAEDVPVVLRDGGRASPTNASR